MHLATQSGSGKLAQNKQGRLILMQRDLRRSERSSGCLSLYCTPDGSIKHLNPMRVKEWREPRMNVVLHKRTEGENNFLLVFFLLKV